MQYKTLRGGRILSRPILFDFQRTFVLREYGRGGFPLGTEIMSDTRSPWYETRTKCDPFQNVRRNAGRRRRPHPRGPVCRDRQTSFGAADWRCGWHAATTNASLSTPSQRRWTSQPRTDQQSQMDERLSARIRRGSNVAVGTRCRVSHPGSWRDVRQQTDQRSGNRQDAPTRCSHRPQLAHVSRNDGLDHSDRNTSRMDSANLLVA